MAQTKMQVGFIESLTASITELNILDGVTSNATELNLLDNVSGLVQADLIKLAAINSTATELNLLNSVSGLVQADLTKLAAVDSTAVELNLLNGVSGLVQADLTKLAAVDSSAAELNLLDGVSGLVQADLTKLAAIDSTAAEINLLDALDRGSILYGNSSGVTTVLGQGGCGTVLTSDGTDISWQAAGGGVVSGGTDNAVLRADGTGGSTSQGSCVIITNAGAISPQFGTASLPGLSFGIDTDTGIYRSGTNILSFATSGVERMRIIATGAVEIETATGCLANLTLLQKSGGTTGAQLFFTHCTSSSDNTDENYIFGIISDNGGTRRLTNYMGMGWVSNCSSSMESEFRFGVMNNAANNYNTTAKLTYAGVWTDSSGEKSKDYEGESLCIYGGIPGQVITDKIKQLSGGRYHTKNHPDWKPILERHISPTAEQFYDLFGTGRDPRQPEVCSAQNTDEPMPGLAPKDMAGVALLGLQELIVRVERLEMERGD